MNAYMNNNHVLISTPSQLQLANNVKLVLGTRVQCAFRYGCHYDRPARDGSPAYLIDLYRRNTIVSGRALASTYLEFPDPGELAFVEGTVINQGDDLAIWVQRLIPVPLLCPDTCIFDTALPQWVVDHAVVDRACALWATLPHQDRMFINSVFHKSRVLRSFLAAPGSCHDHHATDGGCLQHSVEAAELADAISSGNKQLDRDLLVTGALIHDVGKSLEYTKTTNGRWRMSRYGRRVGHKVSGIQLATVAMQRCKDLPSARKEDLIHMLSASYAPRWVGLRPPGFSEAAVLAAIDRVSAEASAKDSGRHLQS